MRYVKLHKCRLRQDCDRSSEPETEHRTVKIDDRRTKLAATMQKLLMIRQQQDQKSPPQPAADGIAEKK
ncbi:hypothetical protein FNV43_RR25533 [Rhamnella rubrinervis]|uniref:Uncharacterized protein n=1 Tax=Rhamnella rubrinervis TaxID=2594499 RepID=A0A8K0DVA4_9ROSA|nr:hypothetical protein FNV43_RR25533 [Rhamnella rubrinervis]